MIPSLLTVAGLTISIVSVSKSSRIVLSIFSRSPLLRHSTRESSSVVFRFSIHKLSCGPSSTHHYCSSALFSAICRRQCESTPSVQFLVTGSTEPKSSVTETLFGFTVSSKTL